MVKRIQKEAVIPGVDVTELCEWLKDPNMYAQYHEEYNHNKKITISDWAVNEYTAERDVYFLMPLRAPAIVRKATGTDVIRVHDQHRVTVEVEDDSKEGDIDNLPPLRLVNFESKPAIAPKGQQDMPFAKVKFVFTNLTMPGGQSACKVEVAIECTAEAFPWLWALHSVIEKVMGAQCKYTADGLIETWQRECRLKEAAAAEADAKDGAANSDSKRTEAAAEHDSPDEKVLPPLLPPMVPDDVCSTGSSVYYDAEDDPEALSTAQHISKKEGRRWKKLFCCFGACTKQDEEAPTQTHLLNS